MNCNQNYLYMVCHVYHICYYYVVFDVLTCFSQCAMYWLIMQIFTFISNLRIRAKSRIIVITALFKAYSHQELLQCAFSL